jgi:hypothetical protein
MSNVGDVTQLEIRCLAGAFGPEDDSGVRDIRANLMHSCSLI